MSNIDVLRNWYTEVWEKGNLDVIGDYFAPDTIANGVVPEMQMGTDDFRDLVMAFQAHVGKFKVFLPKIVEDGDWLSAIVIVRTTRADTGAPIEVTGQVMTRFENGKIVEAYNHFDYISLLEQMGMLPTDTMPICMTGQRLDWQQ
ncbi:ester cyclase [Phaeobacter sp. QD34_3]|uniref:ester cyclase n=1 Tax=unclassified Phaeobacter TaxID=2621772 RepID=UPI00237F1E25|nr:MULTISPECIES: ester cyclase [unclassified Phaeobacter]MDE4131578.1 ester cyclase [Phaeobacter sp. QD34_3]MDE4135333.1 ester cyclase [Phaeobacter sp. QD34_24]MDE4174653.1 ester cyclase [Phaeobacter sp. PT47_59]